MNKISISILLSCLLFVILYHFFAYYGHYGYDDMHYARLAIKLNEGIINFDDHFTFRFPIIILTALSYKLFGINDFASAFPSILVSLLILTLIYFLLKKEKLLIQILGLSLTTFSNWFIFYSDKLMPDIYVALSVILALFIINKYKFNSSKKYPLVYSVLLSLTLLFGFMSKETIVLCVPLFAFFIIIDFIKKRDIKFWLYTIFSGIVILSFYFVLIWILTGDFAKRFDAITSNSYLNLCSYDHQPLVFLLRRISYELIKLMTYQGMMTGFLFVIGFLLRKKISDYFLFNDSFSFFLTSSVILFLSSNFMTISLNSYVPMCLDPRHYLFLIPVVSVSASKIIADFFTDNKYQKQIIITIFIFTILSFFFSAQIFWKTYLPLSVLFALFFILQKKIIKYQIFIIAFILILIFYIAADIKYSISVNYQKQKEIVYENVLTKYDSCYVITNNVQKNIGEYYNNFENSKHTYLKFNDFSFDTLDNRKKILFLNPHTEYLSKLSDTDLPYYAIYIDSANNLLFEDEKLKIKIYELNRIVEPEILVESYNDFEKTELEYWTQTPEEFTTNEKYEGISSMSVNEYSATFIFPLDSLKNKEFNNLLVYTQLYCNYEDKTSSKLVISVEDKDGIYIWESKEINSYIKAFSNWWSVSFELNIASQEIKENSKLCIYLWNNDKQTAFIDNFDIKIMKIN